MDPRTTAMLCFGCALVWIGLAAAGVAREQNSTIGGLLLVAGVVSTLRYLRGATDEASEDHDPR